MKEELKDCLKIIKVIQSCETSHQLCMAREMVQLWKKKYKNRKVYIDDLIVEINYVMATQDIRVGYCLDEY